MELSKADLHDKAARLELRTQAFINGEYIDAASGKTFENISPIDGRILGNIAECDSEDIDRAVTAARQAFLKGTWSGMAPAHRKKTLIRFADLIDKHTLELSLLETLDMGKPISESVSVDIPNSANAIRWHAECCDKLYDEIAPTGPDALGLVTREAIGVVGLVVPWNFPLLMAAWKLGPALATGNSIVLKPAEQSPLTALRIAELASEAGIPDGVLNVVPGFGPTAGKSIGMHMDIDCLAFTGSGEVGKLFLQYSGKSNMKRVWLECGGKSPNIVFSDSPDLEHTAKATASAIFYNQGEVCTAGSRLIVEECIKDEFLSLVQKASQSMQPADPLDPTTQMGAMVDEAQMNRVLGYIDHGINGGAELVFGGKQAKKDSGGFYIEPTIFDNVTNDMTIAREEIFGPVLSTISFKSDEKAIEIANDTQYGLAAAIWTKDITRAHRAAKKIRAGSVWVNCWDGGNMATPFGGFKQSGNGRDKSVHAMEKYTELKTTWISLEK